MTHSRKWSKGMVVEKIRSLEQELGRRPVKRDRAILYQRSRQFFGAWNRAMAAAGYSVKKFQVPRLPEIGPEFCYFAGLVSTDGHLVHKRLGSNKVLVYSSYPDECKMIVSLIQEIFDYKPSIRVRKMGWNKKNNYEIYISSKPVVELLNKSFGIPFGSKSKTIRIPKLMFSVEQILAWNYLRGVIDGDGDIVARDYLIRISSGSPAYLRGLRTLLERLGVTKVLIKHEKTAFRLYIYGKSNVIKIFQNIYPARHFYSRKRDTLVKLLSSHIDVIVKPAVAQTDSLLSEN